MSLTIPYTVFVHVIEARDLRGKDSNNLSDPYIVVSCHGQSQRTEITRNQVNVLWDRMFVFQDVQLNKDEFDRDNIHLQVFDANVIMRNELIGQFAFGIQKVWSQPKPTEHQFYKKWVILTDPADAFEQMGFLLCSVTVLGPGDHPPTHLADEIVEPEVLRAPTGLGSTRRGYNMMVKVYRGEEIASPDGGEGGSDPFLSIKFNGIVMRTQPEYATTMPEWNTILVFPVFTPCLTDNIDVQLWSYKARSPDVLISTHRIKFSDLLSNQMFPTWVNLYRLPYAETSGMFSTGGEGNLEEYSEYCGRIQIAISTNITDDPIMDERACRPVPLPPTSQYELHVDLFEMSGLSSALKGTDLRIEVVWGNQRVETEPAVPRVFDGEEDGGGGGGGGGEDDGILEFVCKGEGNYEFYSDSPNEDEEGELALESKPGRCQLKTIAAQLPRLSEADIDLKWAQLPDVFVNLYSGDVRIGYIRYDAQTVYKKSNAQDDWLKRQPEWAPIRGMARSGRVRSIGFLLFHMSMGQVKRGDDVVREKMTSRIGGDSKGDIFHVRAHVYMAKNLRAANPNGLSSTFVEVSIGGKKLGLVMPQVRTEADDGDDDEDGEFSVRPLENDEEAQTHANCMMALEDGRDYGGGIDQENFKQTAVVEDTLNPIWMQTLYARMTLPVNPDADPESPLSLGLAPDIVLSVYNEGNAGVEDYIGRATFPPVLAYSRGRPAENKHWPGYNSRQSRPLWLQLRRGDLTVGRKGVREAEAEKMDMYGTAADCEGELLVWLEIIRHEDWEELADTTEPEVLSDDIGHRWPEVTKCELHLISLGLRNLAPLEMAYVKNPQYDIIAPNFPDREVIREKYKTRAEKMLADRDSGSDSESDDGDSGSDGEGRGARWKNDGGASSSGSSSESDEDAEYQKYMYGYDPKKRSDEDQEKFGHKYPIKSLSNQKQRTIKLHSTMVRWRSSYHAKDEKDREVLSAEGGGKDEESGGSIMGKKDSSVQKLPSNSSPYHWHEIRMIVTLPKDPFYCGSMSVIVTDMRDSWSSSTETVVGSCNIPLIDHVLSVSIWSRKDGVGYEQSGDVFYSQKEKDTAKKSRALQLHTFWHLDDKIKHLSAAEDDEDNIDGGGDGSSGGGGEGGGVENGMSWGGESKGAASEDEDDEVEGVADENTVNAAFNFCVCLEDDLINMVFDEEITEFRLEENEDLEGMENEMRQAGGGDDDDDDAVYWPGDFEEKEEELGRKTLAGTIEDDTAFDPDYSVFTLLQGQNREDEGRGRDVSSRDVGKFKAFLRIWPMSEARKRDASGNPLANFRTEDMPPHEPKWFNRKQTSASAGGEDEEVAAAKGELRKPRNLWLSELNHEKFPKGAGAVEWLKVRVYIMKAHSLAPMRAGNSSNPYVELQLNIPQGDIADMHYQNAFQGLFHFSDEQNYKMNTIQPDFNAWYEMDAILPGVSTLDVSIKDHGYVRNTPIGSTRIDLEDRWFSREWRGKKDIQQVPRESRTLTDKGSRIPQGTLEMWVEIYEPSLAVDIPVVPIAPPKVTEWEMRVVVWDARKVPRLRDKRSMNMYVVGEFLYFSSEDSTRGPQQLHETDVHDGVRDGNGKFNWRMKYAVQVPCKHPRLRIQVYDHDMFSLDGFACETIINLETLFREALLSQNEVKRPKKHFRLSASNHIGESRGEIDLQINLLPVSQAEKNPVGNARDKPNEDPFLGEPERKRSGLFDNWLASICMKYWWVFLFLIAVGAVVVVVIAPV